jgi:hypothetical protein
MSRCEQCDHWRLIGPLPSCPASYTTQPALNRACPPLQLHILTRYGGKLTVDAVMWHWLGWAKNLQKKRDGDRLPRVYVTTRHISDDLYPRLYLGESAGCGFG